MNLEQHTFESKSETIKRKGLEAINNFSENTEIDIKDFENIEL